MRLGFGLPTCPSNIGVLKTCVSLLLSMQSKKGSACHGIRHQKPLRKTPQQTTQMLLPRIHSRPILGPSTSDTLPKHLKRSHPRTLNLWVLWRTYANGMNNLVRARERNDVYKCGGKESLGLWIPRSGQGRMRVALRIPVRWHGESCQ